LFTISDYCTWFISCKSLYICAHVSNRKIPSSFQFVKCNCHILSRLMLVNNNNLKVNLSWRLKLNCQNQHNMHFLLGPGIGLAWPKNNISQIFNVWHWIRLFSSRPQPFFCHLFRYLYLVHGDWFHSKVPNLKLQCFLSILLDIATTCFLLSPVLGIIRFFGNYVYWGFANLLGLLVQLLLLISIDGVFWSLWKSWLFQKQSNKTAKCINT